MKGLAQIRPETLTLVKVQNRMARSYYGKEWRARFDEKIHRRLIRLV